MAVTEAVKNYLMTLAGQYGLDSTALLAKAEADPNAAKLIEDGVMLRSDYSRGQDAGKRLDSLMWGAGRKIKEQALELAALKQDTWM